MLYMNGFWHSIQFLRTYEDLIIIIIKNMFIVQYPMQFNGLLRNFSIPCSAPFAQANGASSNTTRAVFHALLYSSKHIIPRVP